MNVQDATPRYPIGAVARQTGLSPHVLRAWERRYHVVEPGRTAGGDRLYSAADIARFQLLGRLVAAGHPIGAIAALPLAELNALLPADQGPPPGAEAEELARETLAAVAAMDAERVRHALSRAAVALASGEFISSVALPVLRSVGDLWEAGRICPAHEHVLSAQLAGVLHRQIEALTPPAGAPEAVAATPAGHRHEFGALLAALVAAQEGWRVTFLGGDLPAGDIATAARARTARLVLLGASLRRGGAALEREVAAVKALVGPGVDVLVGGAGALEEPSGILRGGAECIADFGDLRRRLRVMREGVWS